jgi:hypothetical protein
MVEIKSEPGARRFLTPLKVLTAVELNAGRARVLASFNAGASGPCDRDIHAAVLLRSCRVCKLGVIALTLVGLGCDVGRDEEQAWGLRERRTVSRISNMREAEPSREVLSVTIPLGLELRAVAIAAREAVSIEQGAAVNGVVSSLGSLTVGKSARVGSLYGYGESPPVLTERASVAGYVKSVGVPLISSKARIGAGVLPNVPDWIEAFDWRVGFPASNSGVCSVGEGESLALEPGSYAALDVTSGASAVLRTGTYYFRSLRLPAGARLALDNVRGPVYVWVAEQLELEGRMVLDWPDGNVLLGYAGREPVSVRELRATLVAPSSLVRVRAGEISYGAIFAREVQVEARASLVQRGFEILPVDLTVVVACRRCAREAQASPRAWKRMKRECIDCPPTPDDVEARRYRAECSAAAPW